MITSSCTPNELHWATDLHLDHCDNEAYEVFVKEVKDKQCPCLILAGDIANGISIKDRLLQLSSDLNIPIYFVLGNHDFYGRSIEKVRKEITVLSNEVDNLVYLSSIDQVVEIAPNIALIGHDGWADGQAGDYTNSEVMLQDYIRIAELSGISKQERLQVLKKLGKESAAVLRRQLLEAFTSFNSVLCVTHAPPFTEACLYEDQPANPLWAPHFVNHTLGEMLLDLMRKHTDKRLRVICGHSHHQAYCQPLPNLEIVTGGAVYGAPQLQADVPFFL